MAGHDGTGSARVEKNRSQAASLSKPDLSRLTEGKDERTPKNFPRAALQVELLARPGEPDGSTARPTIPAQSHPTAFER